MLYVFSFLIFPCTFAFAILFPPFVPIGVFYVELILSGATLIAASALIGQRKVFISICLGVGGLILLAATIFATIIGSMFITGLPVD